jgi:hypothetical protein
MGRGLGVEGVGDAGSVEGRGSRFQAPRLRADQLGVRVPADEHGATSNSSSRFRWRMYWPLLAF